MTTPSSTRRTRHVTKKGRTGPFVRYVGPAAKRTITSAEWRQLNIELKDDKAGHEWSAANDFLMESAQFSDAQLDYLFIDDAGRVPAHDFIEVERDAVDGDYVQVAK